MATSNPISGFFFDPPSRQPPPTPCGVVVSVVVNVVVAVVIGRVT